MAAAQHIPLSNGRWGLVAWEQIQPGTIIRQEEPLVFVDLPVSYVEWSDKMEQDFYAAEYDEHDKSRYITKALSKLSDAQRGAFRQISTHRSFRLTWRLDINRFQLNATVVPHTLPDGRTMTRLVVLHSLCGINHSCRPNSVFKWSGEQGVVRAITAIAPGEEIVLDRLPEDVKWRSASQRKTYLKERYAYSCGCSDCHPDTCKQGDQIRRRLRDLREKLKQSITSEAAPEQKSKTKEILRDLSLANEYLSLIRQLTWRDERLVEAHVCLAKALEASGDHNSAKEHAVLAIVMAARVHGSDVSGGVVVMVIEILQRCFQAV